MREFIEELFAKDNKIEFQYEDYEISFYAGRFKSYYLIFLYKDSGRINRVMEKNKFYFQNNKTE